MAQKDALNKIELKDKTEHFFRKYLLNPLRYLGDITNRQEIINIRKTAYVIILSMMTILLLYGISHDNLALFKHNQWFILYFLIIGIVALVIANRCISIKYLIIYLILFEVSFTNIAWFDNNKEMIKIGIFHLINISTVLIMLWSLARDKKVEHKLPRIFQNLLPTRVFYLTFGLILLIGIPGTASFISEFYLLNAILNFNGLFAVMYICLIILLAIVIMHSLQLYVFNKKYARILSSPISKQSHWLFLATITLNIFCGLHPIYLLNLF